MHERSTRPHPSTSPGRGPRPGRRPRRALALALAGATVTAIAATGCISSAEVAGNVLTIVGTEYPDEITLRLKAGNANLLEVDDSSDPAVEFTFDRSTFTSIVVEGLEGNDTLVIDQSNGVFGDTEQVTLRGGDGDDTLIGGTGSQTIDGGPGNDVIEGRQGVDVLLGGADADTFRWSIGDANDTFDGGAGTDRIEVTGSAAGETFGLANVGGLARFTRPAIAVDLGLLRIEGLDLRPVGGADTLEISSLSGTALGSVVVDLATAAGVDDLAVDQVRVPPTAVVSRAGAEARVTGIGTDLRIRNGALNDRLAVVGTAAIETLNVDGTNGDDTVAVAASGGEVFISGITPGLPIVASAMEVIDVDLGGGDDTFGATGNLAALTSLDISGGDGRDTIAGGNGHDWIDGGADDDTIDGNQGFDVVIGGSGRDTVVWDAGDGNDQIDGGSGADRLIMTGSAANENYAVNPISGGARLTRDIGSVFHDLVGVETVDLRAVGGADTVTVEPLTGTGLTTVAIDLGSGGVPDLVVDRVVVNGTAGADTISVVGVGSTVEVNGLPWQVRVARPDVGSDQLVVNGLGGADTITATIAAHALMALTLVP